jgi:hypothetical protein
MIWGSDCLISFQHGGFGVPDPSAATKKIFILRFSGFMRSSFFFKKTLTLYFDPTDPPFLQIGGIERTKIIEIVE